LAWQHRLIASIVTRQSVSITAGLCERINAALIQQSKACEVFMAPIRRKKALKAYENADFLESRAGRLVRIVSEFVEPQNRLAEHGIVDTIVFMGSARLVPRKQAEKELQRAKTAQEKKRAEMQLEMSTYYEAASELAERLTRWSKDLHDDDHRFVISTGGGPGIMEAANRGASRARGVNLGMSISIPNEQTYNKYITRELIFHFHYFFMRKFWLAYMAKAAIFFPGGFGTLDELFEFLTLLKTKKFRKHLPIVLFCEEFWRDVVDFDALVRYGTIDPAFKKLFIITDSVDEAFQYVTGKLADYLDTEKGTTL
jgi:uncharacterized protein (TIGR00730 family)